MVEAIAGAAGGPGHPPFDADAWVEQNEPRLSEAPGQAGRRAPDCASYEDSRCLGCATVCETCTEVCPNRANVAVWVPACASARSSTWTACATGCGNCATFCPYDSRPYQDKFTLFWSADDFENSRTRLHSAWRTAEPGCAWAARWPTTTCPTPPAACTTPCAA